MEFKAEIIAYHCQTLLSSEHCLKSGAVISALNSARSAPSKLLKHMTECSPIFGTACSYLFTLATERTRKSVEKHDGIGANSSWKLATCQRNTIGFLWYFCWFSWFLRVWGLPRDIFKKSKNKSLKTPISSVRFWGSILTCFAFFVIRNFLFFLHVLVDSVFTAPGSILMDLVVIWGAVFRLFGHISSRCCESEKNNLSLAKRFFWEGRVSILARFRKLFSNLCSDSCLESTSERSL